MRRVLLALVVLAGCQSGPADPVTEAGTLEDGDLTLASGEFYDTFDVDVREGQWIWVEVTADGFDPYLIARSPSGAQSEVDDSEAGDTTRTAMSVRAHEAGRWNVLVTSFAPGGAGRYTVTYEVSDTQPAGAPAPMRGGETDAEMVEV